MSLFLLTSIGFATGWGIHQLAYYLPYHLGKIGNTQPHAATPALWQFISGVKNHGGWFWLHLTTELLTAMIFAVLWVVFKPQQALLYMIGYSFLMLISVIDVQYRLILNVTMYPAMLLILILNITMSQLPAMRILMGGSMVFAIFYGTSRLKPGQLGAGDVKLATLMGLFFGFPNVLWALLVGAGSGGVVAIVMLFSRRYTLKSTFPYAPFLCFGAMIALLYNPFVF